jgi:hypothetical protein
VKLCKMQGWQHGAECGAQLRVQDTLRHGDARRTDLAVETGSRGGLTYTDGTLNQNVAAAGGGGGGGHVLLLHCS